MSTLKVVNVQHPSATTAAITLDAAGGALIGGQAAYSRNLLYNGAMQVAQRGTSAAGIATANDYYLADRWALYYEGSTSGTWTQSVENDAPTGSGFRKSVKQLCTTGNASPASGARLLFVQRIEGQDCQRIAKGTASARQLTMSFWVKSNVTGTYTAELVDNDNLRGVSASYTVSASATWERKTITFPADTTGVFDNDNSSSLQAVFWLVAGSNFTSGALASSWANLTSANRAVGQVNLAAATNNYWQVTGVQLEVGPAATPFEFKSFGQDLRECQRYYQVEQAAQTNYTTISNGSGGFTWFFIYGTFPVTMRSTATIAINPSASGRFTLVGGTAATTVALDRGAPPTSGSLGNVWTGAANNGYTLYLGSPPSGIGRGEIVTLNGSMLMFSAEL